MLDIKRIREDFDNVKKAVESRGQGDFGIDNVITLDKKRRELLAEVEQMKNKQSVSSKQIPVMKKEGQDTTELMAEMKNLSDEIKVLDAEVGQVEADLRDALRALIAATPGLTPRGSGLTRDYLAALLTGPVPAGNDDRLRDVVDRLAAYWAAHLETGPDDPLPQLRARAFYVGLVGAVFAVASGQLSARAAMELMDRIIDEQTAPPGDRSRG